MLLRHICQLFQLNYTFFPVFPHLIFQGTNCKAEDKHCRTYAHLGKNLTCVARYRPNVSVNLTWSVRDLFVPLNPTPTMYRNLTEEGVLYYEAYSDVKFAKVGNYRYTCTAKTARCGPEGCKVTDMVLGKINGRFFFI